MGRGGETVQGPWQHPLPPLTFPSATTGCAHLDVNSKRVTVCYLSAAGRLLEQSVILCLSFFGRWQATRTECVIVSIMDANVVILILGFLPYREAVGVGELVCREWMKVHRRARAGNWDLLKTWTMTIHTHDRTCYKSLPGAPRWDRMCMPY